MKAHRNGENGSVPSRNDRFFQSEEYWYYTTREGVNIGPFDSLEEAANGADEFIDFIGNVEPAFIHTLEQYSPRALV